MEVKVHKRVLKFLDSLDNKRRDKILKLLKALENFPFIRADIKKIGEKTYRIRVGKIRVIMDYFKEKGIIYVKYVDFRGKVYKKKL